MDVVYPYKATDKDFVLRYSLRSLANLPHGRIFVAGDAPKGFTGVVILPVKTIGTRYQSSTANILAAAESGYISDRFVVMHDDIFVLKPWTFRHEDRGLIEEYLATGAAAGPYRQHTQSTLEILNAHGIEDPLLYSLHTPTVYVRSALVEVIKEFAGQPYLLRTLYHNLIPQPSARRDDVKVHSWSPPSPDMDVLSISDGCARSFGFKRWIDQRFPCRSKYEG